MNGLTKTAPNLTNGSSWTTTTSGTTSTFTNGDIVVTYTLPTTVTANDPRAGNRVTVRLTYHQDILLPVIGGAIPVDVYGIINPSLRKEPSADDDGRW